MTQISVDFDNKTGKIKAMHGIGQPPSIGTSTEYFTYLKEAHIPYSRLHDVGGWFGGNMFVDIPNIFRDFEKDETEPENYDFTFTDILIKGLVDNGCEPYFRLGVTIENFHKYKYYRIVPPKDNLKWAKICEHIIRHYNEGWADGFHYDIKYWEIWNEPDNSHLIEENEMWKGTEEQYFDLYRVASKHLKSCFGDRIKIGGYGSCGFYAVTNNKTAGQVAMGTKDGLNAWESRISGFYDFFIKFVKIVKDEKLPLDFFSYHSYAKASETVKMHHFVEEYFEKAGLSNVELHLNEWNTNARKPERGKSVASANALAMMLAMQNTKMQVMCYYDAQIGASVYGGLFNPLTYEPFCTYYVFKAFGELYELENQVLAVSDNENVYCAAAEKENKKAVLISNTGKKTTIKTNLPTSMEAYLIDENNFLKKKEIDVNSFDLEENQAILLKI